MHLSAVKDYLYSPLNTSLLSVNPKNTIIVARDLRPCFTASLLYLEGVSIEDGINHAALGNSWLILLQAGGHAPLQRSEHRDAFHRLKRINRENYNHDHFVRSYDGRLDLLLVQAVDLAALPREPSLEWNRVQMSTKTTPLNKVLYWTWSSTQPGSKAQRIFDEHPYLDVALKWIPSCTAMLLLVS